MLSNKKLNLVISILAAIVIWAFVTLNVNAYDNKPIRGIPVELLGLEELALDGYTVENSSYTVDIRVSGLRSELDGLRPDDFIATANMKGFKVGENEVSVNITGPERVTIDTDNQRITVNVVELISVTKPIKLEYDGSFPDNMEPGFVSLSPHEIDVSGTREQVKKVSHISVMIDATLLKEQETTLNIDAIPVTRDGDQVYDVNLSQNVIQFTATLCYVKEFPLHISVTGNPEEGKTVTGMNIPEKVVLRGSRDALANVDEVVEAPINIKGIKETTIFTPDLNLPKGVELADASRELSVTVEIGGVEIKTLRITGENVEIDGLAEEYNAHINTGTIILTVFGSPDQIKDFTADDVRVFVSMKDVDYNNAFFDLPLLFKFDKKITRIEASPTEVRVLISKIPGITPENPVPPETEDGTEPDEP